MNEYFLTVWAQLTAFDVLGAIGVIILVSSLFEKAFGVEFIGIKAIRLFWRIVKFLCGWATMPVKPYFEEFRAFTLRGVHIEQKITELIDRAEERETQRNIRFDKLETSLDNIEKEVTLNGGGSIKDAVTRLVRHDSGTWDIMVELRESSRLTNLRLDILDDADKRMHFRMSLDLACTKISPSFLRFFGYTEEDMLGSDWEFCIAERSRPDTNLKWRRSAEKRIQYRNEQFIVDSDGKEYRCLVRGYPVNDIDGEFAGFYGTVEVLQ